jgi:ribose transport system substrate-binding protein
MSEYGSLRTGKAKAGTITRWAALMIAFVLLATACASDDAVTAGPVDSAKVAEARQLLEQAMEKPEFVAPPSYDISVHAGKEIWMILCCLNPFTDQATIGFETAAAAAGMTAVRWDGKFAVNEWDKGIREAIARGADGLALYSIDPDTVSQAIKAATEAGIPIVEILVEDDPTPLSEGIYGRSGYANYDGSLRSADYAIVQTNGTAKVLLLNDPKFKALQVRYDAWVSEFRRLCPGCELITEIYDVTQSPSILSTVTNALQRNPDFDYIFVTHDGAVPLINEALVAVGQMGEVGIISGDNVDSNLDLIRRDDGSQEADFGPAPEWIGWATVDQLGRAMSGLEPVKGHIPIRFVTKDNLPENNAELFEGVDFESGYLEAWGLG